MRKRFLILVALLMASMVSMVTITQSPDGGTRFFVNPSSITNPALQPQTAKTIRPNADGSYGDWTNSTVGLRPNGDGTYSDWTGRILTLNPDGEGTYRQWPSWNHLQPTTAVDQNYTFWAGTSGQWDDWPDPDGDSSVVSASSTSYNNQIETSALTRSPDECRSLTIQKLRVNIVAKYYETSDEQVQMMLSTVYNANISSFTVAPGWDGWTRTGSSPWIDKEDYSTSYISSSVTGDRIGNFTFADIPTGIAWKSEPGGVAVRLKIWQNPLGNDAVKIYLYNGTYWKTLTGLTPQAIPDPSYFDYGTQTDIDVYDFLNTRDKINNAKMAIEKVTVGDPDTIYIDYACIHLSGVTTPSSYGVATALTPSYRTYYSDWSTSPFTSLAWTWSEVDGLQAGVRAIQVGPSWTGTLRVTQLYVGILTNQGFYTDWDEYPNPTGPNGGDEDFFGATADALRQSSTLANHGSEAWSISKVRVTAVASNPDTLDATGREVVTGWDGWSRTGSSPWLDAADYSTNYMYTSAYTAPSYRIGNFTFRDVPPGSAWDTVTLRLRAWRSSTVPQLKVYLYNGASYTSTTIADLSTTSGSYYNIDVSSFLNTEAKINAAKIAFEKLGTTGTVYVDYACLSLGDREKVQLMIALSGVAYDGAEAALTTTYTEYTNEWTTNPATGLPWTWSDIDNLEAGVKSKVSGVWTGEIRVTQLHVKVFEAGTYASWDDPLPENNGDTDYLSAISGGLSQSSGLENQPVDVTWTPARVQVTIVAKTDTSTDDKVRIMLVISGAPSPYYGTSYTLTTSYATYTQVWTTNPYTLGSWDWTAINNMQVGVQSVQTGTVWKGEVRVTQLYAIVGRDGAYGNWDETSANDDADYFSATTTAMRESSQLEDVVSPPAWDIGRVRVVIVARSNVATDEQVQLMLVIGGTVYPGKTYAPTTSYQTYTADWGKNPKYNIPWNWTAITDLQAGVTSVQNGTTWKGEIRITQLYVEVAGPRFMVNIDVENVANLYGYSIQLRYDTSVTTATAIIFNYTFFTSQAIQQEEVNDALGYAWLGSQSTAGLKSGNGTLATIIFLVDSTGTTTLDLRLLELYDNLFTDIYWIVGDVDVDRTIDVSDLSLLSDAYGSTWADSNWNQYCDFNTDYKVDVFDLFAQSRNYGKTYAYDGSFSNG